MAYTLRIIFSGLCMFVPDQRGGKKKMHVLLPDSRLHSGAGHVDAHFVRLFYDRGHEAANGTLTGKLIRKHLDDREWVVQGLGGSIDLTLPKQIVNLSSSDLTNKAIPTAIVDGADPKSVWTRVTLESGAIESCRPGAYWKLGSKFVCMTNRVVWRIDVPDAEKNALDLDLKPLRGMAASTALKLHKTVNKEEITIHMYNSTEKDMPDQAGGGHTSPGAGYKATHFTVFYDLLNGSALGPPVLVNDVGQCPSGTEDKSLVREAAPVSRTDDAPPGQEEGEEEDDGVDPYRCMVAGGTLG